MLSLGHPFPSVPGAWFDHAEPGRVHILPDTLAPGRKAGRAELSMVLHADDGGRGGGLFQARFVTALSSPGAAAGTDWSVAPIHACRMRVTPRTSVPAPEMSGLWCDAVLDGGGGMLVDLFLNAQAGQMMRQLALGGGRTLDLTAELDVIALAPGLPFRATLPGTALWGLLHAHLGDGPVTPHEIERAFLSLPQSMIRFTPDGPGADPGPDALLTETAARALPVLFRPGRQDEGRVYRLMHEDEAAPVAISLNTPGTRVLTHRLDWSLSAFVERLTETERQRHFPQVRAISPFADVDIRVLNQIPLDPKHALSATLDLTCPGPGGTPQSHTLKFRPGEPIARTITTRYPAITQAFEVASRLRLLIAPSGRRGFPRLWPAQAAFDPADDPFTLRLTPERAQLAVVTLKSLPGLFDHCSAVLATFLHEGGQTVAQIDVGTPQAHVVLPGHRSGVAYRLRLEALPPQGVQADAHVLHDGPESDQTILLTEIDLIVQRPDLITCRIADTRVRFAVIDLRRDADSFTTTRVLRPGETTHLPVWRASVFSPRSYEWRAAAVRTGDDGRTLPIVQGDWTADGKEVLDIV